VHERALMDDLVRKVLAVADAEEAVAVTRIRVRLGVFSHFTPEHFREHWRDASAGTRAAAAEVEAAIDESLDGAAAQGVVLESVEVRT
jgi:hydrogenase nickel incorporation protein HypA/HybF